MPQILQWPMYTDKPYRFAVRAVLVLVLISCWHFVVWFAPSFRAVKESLFVIDEIANWMLIIGFSYLLSASMPDWVKEQFLFLFPKKNRAQVT
jgi:hypothetical protein